MGQGVCRSCVVTSVEELWSDELAQQPTIAAIAVAVTEVAVLVTVSTISGDSLELTCKQKNNIQLTVANLKQEVATSEWRVPYACQKLASMDPNVDGILQDGDHLIDRDYLLVISFEVLDSECAGAQQADTVLQDLARLGPSCMKSFHVATMQALSGCLDIDGYSPIATCSFRSSSCIQAMAVFVQFADKGDHHATDILGRLARRHQEAHVRSAALSSILQVAEKGDQHAIHQVCRIFTERPPFMVRCVLAGSLESTEHFSFQLAAMQAIIQLAEKGDGYALAVLEPFHRYLSQFPDGWTDSSGVDCKTVKHALKAALDTLDGNTADVEQYHVLHLMLPWRIESVDLTDKISELDEAISAIDQQPVR